MKSGKILSAAVSALAVIAVIATALIACESATFDEKVRPATKLTNLIVQPVTFENGLPVNNADVEALTIEAIPEPVNEDDWDDSYFNLAEADLEELWFLLEDHTQTARIIYEATPGTVVTWGLGTTGTRPPRFTRPGEPLTFTNDDVIYVRVSTRDEQYRSHYRIHARLASKVTLLSLMTVAGRETKIAYNAGREDWDDLRDSAVPELAVSISLKEGTNGSDILTTKMDERSSVRYAKLPASSNVEAIDLDALDFEYWENKTISVYDPETDADVLHKGTEIIFADQDLLVAEVTAQNTFARNYYKFRVSVGHIVNINTLEMTAGPEVSQVLALGVPNDNWTAVVSGNFATAAVDPTFTVNITLEDEDGDYEFVKIAVDDSSAAFSGKPQSVTFGIGEELAIKVTSATQTGGQPAAYTFYKVRVNLQSAIIKVQPKSNVYYVTSHTLEPANAPGTDYDGRVLIDAPGTVTIEGTVEPLKAELDRDPPGATYQWYTANSWYGGYGFDKEGRILGDPGFTYDLYHPTTERGPGDGGFDEKNNVSFHNGGNQFYRLPVGSYPDTENSGLTDAEGKPLPNYAQLCAELAIPGATSAEYIPKIDASKRPFIAGYSNQTQYYWVVIKDSNGREVVSEWATIVTEWGEVWDLGKPSGDKVTKKHHIVDLYAYLNPGTKGLQDKPINTVPFKAGKHGDKYTIPINFPNGFDIMDYRVATVQAKFYLADGTVWIQNWTQGDVGFEKDGQGQVLYYNLTNNNATVGLAGDSKEPQGADLTDTPTHVVVKPAGEKPINDRPPFEVDGKTPKPNNDAQGWFTPYIEIVELRFEGPARER